jgi:hypothetical protein
MSASDKVFERECRNRLNDSEREHDLLDKIDDLANEIRDEYMGNYTIVLLAAFRPGEISHAPE